MIVTIHQPEHLPWLGFFDKVSQADCFVLLDHVQFRKNYFQNRNRIRSAEGSTWLTVPVRLKGRFGQPLNQVEIDNSGNPKWREKSWKTIAQYYGKAPFFNLYAPFFESLYRTEWQHLVDLNERIIGYVLSVLGIQVSLIKSSSMDLEERKKGDLVLDISKKVGAGTYLSGISGPDYLELEKFAECGIELKFQNFRHPVYRQLFDPFIPNMSIIDLLFNHGPQSLDIIKGLGAQAVSPAPEGCRTEQATHSPS
jgi:WbqC-like protein